MIMDCPNCGENIEDSDSFCYKCGEKINSDNEKNNKQSNDKNKSTSKYIGLIILLILGLIFGLIFITAAFLTGLTSLEELQNKKDTSNNSNISDLYLVWNKSDDYPNIDGANYKYDGYRNKVSISDYGIDRWSDKNYIETSSGIYPYHLPNDTREYLNNVYLFNISSNDYFSLYVIEGNTTKIYSDLLEDPSSLHSYDTVDKYTKFKIKEYNETISVNKNNYLVVYAVPGELPNSSIEEQFEYSNKNIKISGMVEKAGYIPYNKFKNNKQVRLIMKEDTIFDE